jgi:hypothetical protein
VPLPKPDRARRGRGRLEQRCRVAQSVAQTPAFDERSEPFLLVAVAHRVRVHAQRERRIGVAELPHDVHGVLAEREEQARERVPQLVRRQPFGQRHQPVTLEVRVRALDGCPEDTAAARCSSPGARRPAWRTRTPPLACRARRLCASRGPRGAAQAARCRATAGRKPAPSRRRSRWW